MKYQNIFPGEYDCLLLSAGKLYSMGIGIPTTIPGQPSVVTAASAAYHHYALLDDKGNAYCWGDNTNGQCGTGSSGGSVNTATRIATDAGGKPFTNIIQIEAAVGSKGQYTMALKGDGTVWGWGSYGNGNVTRPTQIPVPVVVKKIQAGYIMGALDSTGGVWTWGNQGAYNLAFQLGQGNATANGNAPGKVPLPGAAVDISFSSQAMNYALLPIGQLWAWGMHPSYYGFGTSFATQGPQSVSPRLVNSQLGLPLPVAKIATSPVSSYAILTDGSLWAWGDNANGTIGNGKELDYSLYKPPYAWNWGFGEMMQVKAVNIKPGVKFTNVWASQQAAFYAYATDTDGNLYSWGRNKASVLGNGVISTDGVLGQQASSYPNAWDVTSPKRVDPLSLKRTYPVLPEWCKQDSDPGGCVEQAVPGPIPAEIAALPTGSVPPVVTPPVIAPPTTPRTVTGISITINGQPYTIPLTGTTIKFSDGTTQ